MSQGDEFVSRLTAAGCSVLSLGILLGSCFWPLHAAAPVKVQDVTSVADLTAEIAAQVTAAEKLLADKSGFADSRKPIQQAGGVIACLSQAMAEHPEGKKSEIAVLAMRDAALDLARSKEHATSAAALKSVKESLAGKRTSDSKVSNDWKKLINLHRMMDEMKARNSQLRRVIRSPEDPATDARHAVTLAVLSLALQADTHEVKDATKIPKWTGYATDFRKSMLTVAGAIKKKDATAAKTAYLSATKSCTTCHAAFRD